MTVKGTAIIQARIGSTRLPGKAMMKILGKPMLWYAIESLKRSPAVRRVVVALPTNPRDEVLVNLAKQMGVDVFQGPEDNVLERFYRASLVFPDEYYFRATGDNPIIDIDNPGRSLHYLLVNHLDYACEAQLPVGTVVETFTFAALEKSFNEGSSPEDIEHVTWYMKKSGRFRIAYFPGPRELQFPHLRLTVDYPEDFHRVSRFIEALYPGDRIPPFKDIVAFARESGF